MADKRNVMKIAPVINKKDKLTYKCDSAIKTSRWPGEQRGFHYKAAKQAAPFVRARLGVLANFLSIIGLQTNKEVRNQLFNM
jgi:hypothetical protein